MATVNSDAGMSTYLSKIVSIITWNYSYSTAVLLNIKVNIDFLISSRPHLFFYLYIKQLHRYCTISRLSFVLRTPATNPRPQRGEQRPSHLNTTDGAFDAPAWVTGAGPEAKPCQPTVRLKALREGILKGRARMLLMSPEQTVTLRPEWTRFRVVPRGGFEPPTRGFSIRCSTD